MNLRAFTLSASVPLFLSAPVLGQAAFIPLGDLPGGIFQSSAIAISADGSSVVGSSNSASGTQAFRWKNNVIIGLGDLPGGPFFSFARAVNHDGSIVVGDSQFSSNHAPFRWDAVNGMQPLPFSSFGFTSAVAEGISDDGLTIAGYAVNGVPSSYSYVRAILWNNAVPSLLNDLPGGADDSAATGISADASVIIGRSKDRGYRACLWNLGNPAAVPLPLSAFEPHDSYTTAITPDTLTIVGASVTAASFPNDQACKWFNNDFIALDDLPGGGPPNSIAHSISDDAQIIVGQGTSSLGTEAFIWFASDGTHNLQSLLSTRYGLNLAGWTLSSAIDISANGRAIAGFGLNPSGNTEAWLVRLPCAADISPLAGDGNINIDDLTTIILNWNSSDPIADVTHDGSVDIDDLTAVILAWGVCP